MPNADNPVKCRSNQRVTARYIAGIASPSAKEVHLMAGGTAGQEPAALTVNVMAEDVILAATVAGSAKDLPRLSAAKKDSKMRKLFVLSVCSLLLIGCAANLTNLKDNPDLAMDAQIIAETYLEGQSQGESHSLAVQKYGEGVIGFSGIKQYNCEGLSQNSALRFKILTTAQTGADVWKSYDIKFAYDDLNGPRISNVTEVR